MRTMKKLTLTAAIGIVVLLITAPVTAAEGRTLHSASEPSMAGEAPYVSAVELQSGQQADWGYPLNPAGTWLGSNDLGLDYLGTITPLDNTHRRFSIIFDGANDPTMGGYFPTAVDGLAVRGELVRTGPGTYDMTLTTYAVDDTHAIVVYGVISGSLVMTSEMTIDLTMYIAFFAPGQDPFGSEPPLYGCMGPVPATYNKLPLLPPCEP